MATKAKQIDFLLSQVRNSVGSLAGGTITFYAAGGTTLKTIWLDRDKSSVAANPYTFDANGTAQLYADGLYKIVIKNAAESTIYTRDNLEFVFYGDESNYEIDALNDYGGGTSYTQATIESALTAIGTVNKVTLLIRPGNWVILTALAFPANVTVKMPAGAYFSGAAVTAGTITGLKEVIPQVFGADGTGTADSSVAIFSAAKSGVNVVFDGTYKLTSTAAISSNNRTFTQRPGSQINVIGGIAGFTVTGDNVTFDGLKIVGDLSVGSYGIHATPGADSGLVVKNCTISEFMGHIRIVGGLGPRIENNDISLSAVIAGGGNSVWLVGCTNPIIVGNRITNPISASIDSNVGIMNIHDETVSKILVSNNHVIGGYDGINIRGGDATITGNQTHGTEEAGISVNTTKSATITGNLAADSTQYGIFVSSDSGTAPTDSANISIVGNTVRNCSSTVAYGSIEIVKVGTGANKALVSIVGNTIKTGAVGVQVESAGAGRISGVTIVGNTFDTLTSAVALVYADNSLIIGNLIYNTTNGITAQFAASMDGLVATGNTCLTVTNPIEPTIGTGGANHVSVHDNIGASEQVAITTTASINSLQRVALVSVAGGNYAITLPNSNHVVPGHTITLKKTEGSSNTATITAYTGDTIDGGASVAFGGAAAKSGMVIRLDDAKNWNVISNY